MPIKDLEGPPPPDPREIALLYEIMRRLMPETGRWPRWRDRGDEAAASAPVDPRPSPLSGGAAAPID